MSPRVAGSQQLRSARAPRFYFRAQGSRKLPQVFDGLHPMFHAVECLSLRRTDVSGAAGGGRSRKESRADYSTYLFQIDRHNNKRKYQSYLHNLRSRRIRLEGSDVGRPRDRLLSLAIICAFPPPSALGCGSGSRAVLAMDDEDTKQPLKSKLQCNACRRRKKRW